MGMSTIFHKGKKILLVDYSGCKTIAETIVLLNEVRDFFLASDENLVTLNDFSQAPVSNEFMELAKKYSKEVFDVKTIKTASVGISGVKKILLAAFNMVAKYKIMNFDNREEALEYLAG
ncbi:MAG: hypothetical protein JW798_07390 [Prolixibacteraceae bacterium]|nr:hypothetical protein [Prolixibacteraceae bacterium]